MSFIATSFGADMEKPTFHLEGIIKTRGEPQDFEGPLNLILMLLSRNRVEIRDIRISEIVEQYIGYIAGMRELDIDIAGEFVQMASYLVYVKAKTLLKKEEDEPVGELELLMSSLEELKCKDVCNSVKSAAEHFERLIKNNGFMQTKAPQPVICDKNYRYTNEVRDLLESLLFLFSRNRALAEIDAEEIIPAQPAFSVESKSRELAVLLQVSGGKTLRELCDLCADRSEIVAVFISVLELCIQGVLNISDRDGEVLIKLSKNGGPVNSEGIS